MTKLQKLLQLNTEEDKKQFYELLESLSSLTDIYKFYNVSDNGANAYYLKQCANVVGFDLNVYKQKRKCVSYCLNCGKEITGNKKFCTSSCSAKYNNSRRSEETKQKTRDSLKKYYNTYTTYDEKNENVDNKKKNERFCCVCGKKIESGKNKKTCSDECKRILSSMIAEEKHMNKYNEYLKNHTIIGCGVHSYKFVKKDIMREQNYKCAICGQTNQWNGKPLNFVVDHINGDALDHRRDNLRCICPNCDTQLDTYKSKNKNSKRRNFWKEKIIQNTIDKYVNNI